MFKKALVATTSLTLAVGVALPAHAQNDYEDEIIVTATKREQTLQEVPVAVSVTTADTIEKAVIKDVLDLQSVVPSLRVSQLQNSVATNFIIRGFGNGANNAGIEPSVGVFIDGVYRSRSASALADLPNLERVEVLRGPQSTLFGKNASAGVISVVSAKPTYDTQGYVEGALGNYNLRSVKGFISTGIDEAETMAVSLGGSVTQRDGYYDNLLTDTGQNDRDRWGVRGQVLFEPNDDLSFRLIGDYDKIDEICCGVANLVAGPTADVIAGLPGLAGLSAAVGAAGGVNTLTADQLNGLGSQFLTEAPFAYEGFFDFDPVNRVENYGVSMEIEYDINEDITLRSITALREQDLFVDGDVDFTGARLVSQNVNATESTAFTQEIRLEASSGDLDWTLGALYFEDDLVTDTDIRYGDQFRDFGNFAVWQLQAASFLQGTGGQPIALGGILNVVDIFEGTNSFGEGQGLQVGFNQDNEALSLFGQADYHLTDALTLTAGVAYVEDRKTVNSFSSTTDGFSALDLNTAVFGLFNSLSSLQFLPPFVDFPAGGIEGNKTRDDQFTYTLRGAYDVNDDINVYASASTGFKASTWNLSRDSRPFAPNGVTDPAVAATMYPDSDCARVFAGRETATNVSCGTRFAGPEESTVYEIGVKAKLDRGYVNVTAFDQTIEGFQSNVFTGTGFILANAGEQSARGIEVDAAYSPMEGLNLGASATFLDPKFDSFDGGLLPRNQTVQPDGTPGLTGLQPAGIHELSAVLAATYNFDLGEREAYIRGDFQYESDVQIVDAIDDQDIGEFANRSQKLFNASAGLKVTDNVGLQVWGRNILNDEFLTSVFPSVAQAGSFSGYPNQPRTYGATIRYDFD